MKQNIKYCKIGPKAFIEYSNIFFLNILKIWNDNYKNIDEYNSTKKRKILFVFDDMIANMLSNKMCLIQ